MKRERIRTLIFPFIVCAAVLSLISCGQKARVSINQLDTPGHHTFTGLKLLDQEKYSEARREFKMATQLNNNYSKAYTGTALVNIYTGNFESALDNLTQGLKNAQTDDEKLFVYISKMRVSSGRQKQV